MADQYQPPGTGGSTPAQQSSPPPPPPTSYGKGTAVPDETSHGHYSSPNPTAETLVPGTSVHTPSMELFAKNIDALIGPARQAAQALASVDVRAGAFYHATQIRSQINGANGDAGLKDSFTKALADLSQGLADVRDGVTQMAAKYKQTEDANHMSAADLARYMSDAQGDFAAMSKDTGGSAAPPADPGSAPGGTSGSGSAPGGTSGSGSAAGGTSGSGAGSGTTSGGSGSTAKA